jgi:outer membrane protein assembly factor BamB
MRLTPQVLLIGLVCGGAALADNWPTWRGPDGQGHSAEKDLPLRWSTTENVRWKTPLPDEGNSSPVVWSNRVFLTQATDKVDWPPPAAGGPASAHKRLVMCFDRANGRLLWQGETIYKEKESTYPDNPFCAASPVTDGERVIACLGSAGLVCYDIDGKEQWRYDLGKLEHIWGNASSPILHGDLCICWAGPGERQFLVAVNKRTGAKVWQHDEPGGKGGPERPYAGSWSTPIVIRVGGHDELVFGAPGKLKGFDLATGKELWSCDGLYNSSKDELIYSSPVHADGVIVAMGGYGSGAIAVRTGGKGDITKTHRLWFHPNNPQRIGSPVIVGEQVYILSDNGQAQCLDLKTGKDLWKQERLTTSTWASMVAADGRLYVTNRAGDTFVLAAGPTFELLAKNSLDEPVCASLAISDGELFIRTYKHLWCIGARK